MKKTSHKKSDDLHNEIKELYKILRKETKKKWDRVLPFNELLFDRWELAHFLNAKNGSSIYENSYIFGKVIVGKNTWIGPFTLLDGSGGKITIGDFCSISSGVQIYTHHTVKWALTGGKANYEKKAVSIGKCCYLGPYSIVAMGSKIGNCCIIGANTFVNSNIPSNSIVYGTPGKVVGKVKINDKKILLEYFKKK